MHSLLALGDSYTIGEGVPLLDSFPYQTVQQLRLNGHLFYAPEIVARTGWTTDELEAAMTRTRFLPRYDFVTLLIGVNNQYRGRDLEEYGVQFERLLQEATRLAQPQGRVLVLSIPDWGISPFAAAAERDQEAIAKAINSFNVLARQITVENNHPFIDITGHGRAAGSLPENFTNDGLHPNGKEYRWWATELAGGIQRALNGVPQ